MVFGIYKQAFRAILPFQTLLPRGPYHYEPSKKRCSGVPAAEPECPDGATSPDVGQEKKTQEKTTDPDCLDQKLDH